MSAFLAPIHTMMYDKIHFQDDLAVKLIESLGSESLINHFNDTVISTERGELSEVVDLGNIHGWLQNQVNISEVRFASAVKLLNDSGVSIETMKDNLKTLGEKENFQFENAQEVFQFMNKIFLDGMPCDHINSIVENEKDYLIFSRAMNIHGQYFKNLGLDENLYFQLRDSYLKGILKKSDFTLTEEDGKNLSKTIKISKEI